MSEQILKINTVSAKDLLKSWLVQELPAKTVSDYRIYGKLQTFIDEIMGPAFACIIMSFLFFNAMSPDLNHQQFSMLVIFGAIYLFIAHLAYLLSRSWKISAYWLVGIPLALLISVA